jgi:hypothetical protein
MAVCCNLGHSTSGQLHPWTCNGNDASVAPTSRLVFGTFWHKTLQPITSAPQTLGEHVHVSSFCLGTLDPAAASILNCHGEQEGHNAVI